MKRIIVVCEGQTEQEFCKDILQPYFNTVNIQLHWPAIKKSGGGLVQWIVLKKQIENHLSQERDAYVTTFMDYYGIKSKHQFPGWEEAKKIIDKADKMDFLENSMKGSVNSGANRFIPYIQLHEFEGLLFNNITAFDNNVQKQDLINRLELEQIINSYSNPELINDSAENAPSFRLKRLIKGYNKIVYGAIIAESIGLSNIRLKSARFNNWLKALEGI